MDWSNYSVNRSFDKEKQQKYKKNKVYQIRCNACRSLFSHKFVSEKDLDTMARYGLKCDDCEAEDILYGTSTSSSSDDLAFLYDSSDSSSFPSPSLPKKKHSPPKKNWSPPKLEIKASPVPKSPPNIFGPPYVIPYVDPKKIKKPKAKRTKHYLRTLTGGKKRRKRKRTRRKSKRKKSRRKKRRKRRKTRR